MLESNKQAVEIRHPHRTFPGQIFISSTMITIRQALSADLEQIAALFDLYRVWYDRESDQVAAKDFIKARLGNKDSEIIVADENGTLVGFTQLYPQFSSIRMKRSWLLNDLYVLETHRRLGVSKELISAAKQLAKDTGAAGLLLETDKTNMIGNKLYPEVGFELYNHANFYWWENT